MWQSGGPSNRGSASSRICCTVRMLTGRIELTFFKPDVEFGLASRAQAAIYHHVLGNTFPRFLLPMDFRLLVQMRRGSSASFSLTASLAYAIEHDIPFEWAYESLKFPKQRVIGPLDARSLSFLRYPIYTTHFSDALSQYTSGKAFVRLRDPYDQVRSYSAFQQIMGKSTNHALQSAFGYLKEFAYNLESPTMPVKIVRVEDYFSDQSAQLRLCFDYLELEISDASIDNGISQYTKQRHFWASHPDTSPRNSFRKFYPEFSSSDRELLDQLIRSTVLGDYYPSTS